MAAAAPLATTAVATDVPLPPFLAVTPDEVVALSTPLPASIFRFDCDLRPSPTAPSLDASAASTALAPAVPFAPPLSPSTAPLVSTQPTQPTNPFNPFDTLAEITTRAQTAPLSPAQLATGLECINATDGRALQVCGLTAAALPALLDHNHGFVVDAIATLRYVLPPRPYAALMRALVGCGMSLHSIEAVKGLTTRIPDFPPDTLHAFISSCMASCEAQRDKLAQHRSVRLLCAFLTVLVANRQLEAPEVLVEVQVRRRCHTTDARTHARTHARKQAPHS